MHWILLAVLAVVLIVTSSRFPKLGFSLLGLLTASAAGLYYMSDDIKPGRLQTLEPSMITIENIQMSPSYRESFKASGSIRNTSPDHDVTELSIRFSVNDCPSTAVEDSSECEVISQVVEPFRLHIPLGGKVSFEQSVSPRRVLVKGSRRWTFKVVEVKGRVPLRTLDE
jgi:hypothetical protein